MLHIASWTWFMFMSFHSEETLQNIYNMTIVMLLETFKLYHNGILSLCRFVYI